MTAAEERVWGVGAVYVAHADNLTAALEANTNHSQKQREKAAALITRRMVGNDAWGNYVRRQKSDRPLTDDSRSVRKVRARQRS